MSPSNGRRDWAHHLAEDMIRAFFWFDPALGWLIGRMRLAREQVVDFEVVMLTSARKTYLKALLEFTIRRSCVTIVPAPLFLAERQLAERIALMLKEVRMSRTRLILSLTAIACSIFVAITLGARTFPLKGAPCPRGPSQSAPRLTANPRELQSTVTAFGLTPSRDALWPSRFEVWERSSAAKALRIRLRE
jgi:hypothetical protein